MQEINSSKLPRIKERVRMFLKVNGITHKKFFLKTGISTSAFSGVSGKSEFGGDTLIKILSEFPEISPEWLILGQGEMRRSADYTSTTDGGSSNQQVANGDNNIQSNRTTHNTTNHTHNYPSFASSTPDEVCQTTTELLQRQLADKDEYIKFLSQQLIEAQNAIKEGQNALKEAQGTIQALTKLLAMQKG